MDLDIGIGMGGVENGVEMDDLGVQEIGEEFVFSFLMLGRESVSIEGEGGVEEVGVENDGEIFCLFDGSFFVLGLVEV